MPYNVRKSINTQKNIIVCLQCQTTVLDSDGAIECDYCKKTLHLQCTKLNKVEVEKFLDDESLGFKCHVCEPTTDNKHEFKMMFKEMRELKETMKFMSSQYDDILNGVRKNTQDIKNLQRENRNLRESNKQLTSTVAFLSEARVENNCIINGIQTDNNAKPIDVVMDIIKKSGAEISEDKIDKAYFLKQRNNQSSVVVKFVNNRSKVTFMKEKKKLSELDDTKKVYVNDFLSKETLSVFKSISSINKFNKFKNEISQLINLPDVIAIQETWISRQYVNLYKIDGYKAVHCVRMDGFGGTTIFVKSTLKHNTVINKSENNLDIVAIELPEIKLNNLKITILSIYGSQRCVVSNFIAQLELALKEFRSSNILVVGDVNVDLPSSGTCIDWVFSNNPSKFLVCSVENTLSDHNFVFCDVTLHSDKNEYLTEYQEKINYTKFGQLIDPPDLCQKLVQLLSTAASRSTETSTKRINMRMKMAPWINEALHNLICLKQNLLKKRRRKRTNYSLNEQLKRISKIIKLCNKKLLNDYYQQNFGFCGTDARRTWRFLNNELGRQKTQTLELFNENGRSISDDVEKAITLNEYFVKSILDLKNGIQHYQYDDINMFGTLVQQFTSWDLVEICGSDIINVIEALTMNKSSGYDNITVRMICMRGELVGEILAKIFNEMIENRKYPDVLKIHKIIPIPKVPGSRRVTDFRPVAVLPIIDKIFEKIICNQFSQFLNENNILYENQFGFTKGCGTDAALVYVIEYICAGLDSGYKGVAGVFFDYSKAFDLVQHDILLEKLRYIGVSGRTVELLKDYLSNRFQYVQVGESKSNKLPVNYGVPQGSVLGPLLFKIYINDLKNINFNGKLVMFADGLCLFYKYKHETVLQTEIQYDASILSEYARLTKLILNSSKTKFIMFTTNVRETGEMTVPINGETIQESKMVKYLGVNLCSNLLWDEHIKSVKAKVSSATGILHKFRNILTTDTKLMIYHSLIHSHLTYLPIIYAHRSTRTLKELQSAQNKALKVVYNLPLRYPTTLLYKNHAKNILPIRGLYKQKLLLYMFKSVHRLNTRSLQFDQNFTRTGRVTKQSSNLNVARCRIDLTKQRISFAGPTEYNNLPGRLKNICVISSFKNELKSYLLDNLTMLLRLLSSKLNKHIFTRNNQTSIHPYIKEALQHFTNFYQHVDSTQTKQHRPLAVV
ncbi:uncharacterized protein LOC142231348 [Haematobia irritans]|uniref:uncharacterized protein LOC142231348 n=1 Tax=Haematobia irritans TaxID=7368 RepID=UPI003F50853D